MPAETIAMRQVRDVLTQNRRLGRIHPMKLENVLRRVHPNSANLLHGRSPLSEICNDLILARSMPSGAVHTNRMALARLRTTTSRGHRDEAAGFAAVAVIASS
jgi:hypothetical protein